ncbi:MAG: hypothetical protein AAGF06_05885 [Pseudomonadota bacterium]
MNYLNVTKTLQVLSLCLMGVLGTQMAHAINVLDNQPKADAACPIEDVSHTEHSQTGEITVRNYGCNDNNRNVVWSVSVPKVCEQEACGLIIDIHGAGMNAHMQNAGSKLRHYGQIAKTRGAKVAYIVAQPNFTDFFDVHVGFDLSSVLGNAYINELPGMERFVDDIKSSFDIDPNHIHMYGFSRGTHTTNVFYCDEEKQSQYASFVMHGEKLTCDVQDNKPLLMINGIFDFFTPNQQARVNSRIMASLRDQGYQESVVLSERNWRNKKLTFVRDGWFFKIVFAGQHEHRRFLQGDAKWFESIEHSGASLPLAGHCLPVASKAGFLTCRSTFDVGAKIIDFFIAHPKH